MFSSFGKIVIEKMLMDLIDLDDKERIEINKWKGQIKRKNNKIKESVVQTLNVNTG